MIKVIMKRIPKKVDTNVQHQVLENWSKIMVETYTSPHSVNIISAREFTVKADSKKTPKSK